MSNWTLFTSGGSASEGVDYVRDTFLDVSLPPTANTGLTDNANTNPLGKKIFNGDNTTFGPKTLTVKDLVLIEDRSIWVNGQPTYDVVFDSYYPSVAGYVFGDVVLSNFENGKCVLFKKPGGGFGLTGLATRLSWVINPTPNPNNGFAASNTSTAAISTDNVGVGSIDFSDSNIEAGSIFDINRLWRGTQRVNFYNHGTTVSDDLHDFRITANQSNVLSIAGVVVFLSDFTNIQQLPGSTYVDKQKFTTSARTTVALPSITERGGGLITVDKVAANYATSTVSSKSVDTIGIGASGSNLLTVTAGTGASFLVNDLVVASAGSSLHFAKLTNIAIDIMTISPSLPYGVSGPFYRVASAGPTIAIDPERYEKVGEFNPNVAARAIDYFSFNVSRGTTGAPATTAINRSFFISEDKTFSAYAIEPERHIVNGTPVIKLRGTPATLDGRLRLEGNFQAADVEFVGETSSLFQYDVFCNGVTLFTFATTLVGTRKLTIFSNGALGFNSVELRVNTASDTLNAGISKVNLYKLKDFSNETGALSQFEKIANLVSRGSGTNDDGVIVTNLVKDGNYPIGMYQKVFAREMALKGDWITDIYDDATNLDRREMFRATGTSASLEFNYYGKNFAILGVAGTGGSFALSVDGVPVVAPGSSVLENLTTVASEGFHTIRLTAAAVSANGPKIDSILIQRSFSEVKNLQNLLPVENQSNIPKIFTQGDTPKNAKDGDFWIKEIGAGHAGNRQFLGGELIGSFNTKHSVWLKMFGVWNKICIETIVDDPNDKIFSSYFGGNDNAGAGAVLFGENFNFTSWAVGTNSPRVRVFVGPGPLKFKDSFVAVDGANAAGTRQPTADIFNKYTWSTGAAKTLLVSDASHHEYDDFFYSICGNTTGTTASNQIARWNGSTWANNIATTAASRYARAIFVVDNLLRVLAGTGGGTFSSTHETFDGTTVGSDTAVPANQTNQYGASGTCGAGMGLAGCAGSASGTTLECFVWSGTYLVGIRMTSQMNTGGTGNSLGSASGYSEMSGEFLVNGGCLSATEPRNASQIFNGSGWRNGTSSIFVKMGKAGAVF